MSSCILVLATWYAIVGCYTKESCLCRKEEKRGVDGWENEEFGERVGLEETREGEETAVDYKK